MSHVIHFFARLLLCVYKYLLGCWSLTGPNQQSSFYSCVGCSQIVALWFFKYLSVFVHYYVVRLLLCCYLLGQVCGLFPGCCYAVTLSILSVLLSR